MMCHLTDESTQWRSCRQMFLNLLSHLTHSPDLNPVDYSIWGRGLCSCWYIIRLGMLIIWSKSWTVAGTSSVKS